jgi:hypothetical protein
MDVAKQQLASVSQLMDGANLSKKENYVANHAWMKKYSDFHYSQMKL